MEVAREIHFCKILLQRGAMEGLPIKGELRRDVEKQEATTKQKPVDLNLGLGN